MSPGAESLTLEVMGPQADELGPARRKTFGAQGGTIGRAAGNEWVLADPYVSSRHATIEFHDGAFLITDNSSRNGVFVNGQRLEPGCPHQLQPDDLVFIEPYEMSVVADAGLQGIPNRSSGSEAVRGAARTVSRDRELSGLVEPDAVSHDNWLDLLAPPDDAPRQAPRSGISSVSRDPLQEAVVPPVPRPILAPVPLIPAGYDPLADSGPIEQSVPGDDRRPADGTHRGVESPAAVPEPHGVTVDLRALLAGAGLEGVTVPPELAEQLGQILRVVVEGLLDVLKSRQEIKDEFRIRHTVMKRRGNNPLKFAVDVEDALHNLLVKKNPGYLGPVAAFEDAFADVRHHQVAMLAGVRDAFERMLAQFHPDNLQQEFNRHAPRRGGLQVLQSKPDYWEFYREFVQRLASDPDGSFRTLFGEEFAKAYERKLDGTKAESHGARADGPAKGAQER